MIFQFLLWFHIHNPDSRFFFLSIWVATYIDKIYRFRYIIFKAAHPCPAGQTKAIAAAACNAGQLREGSGVNRYMCIYTYIYIEIWNTSENSQKGAWESCRKCGFYLFIASKNGWMPLTGFDTFFVCWFKNETYFQNHNKKRKKYISNHVETVLNFICRSFDFDR